LSEEKKEEIQTEEVAENETEVIVEETAVVEETMESVKADLEEKLKEAEDKYLRVHADFENIKKRLEKEKYNAIDYASEKFAKDLLAPIDSLEMALAAEEAASDMPADGIENSKDKIRMATQSEEESNIRKIIKINV